MANIRDRGNNSYQVTVSIGYDSKGKKLQKSKSFKKPHNMTPSKWDKEIHKIALEYETEILKGLYLDSDITLKDFIDKWIKDYANQQLEQTTLDSYKGELKNKIIPALGHIKLNKLMPMQILSFLNNLMEDGVRIDGRPGGYSDRTIKYQWQILSSILQQAVYWQIMPENPCGRIKAPKNKKSIKDYNNESIKFYDENQTMLLIEIVNNIVLNYQLKLDKYNGGSNTQNNLQLSNPRKYQIAIYIAIFCGLRNGELLGLTWNDINFNDQSIGVNKSRALTVADGMITKLPKNNTSIRTVSIPDSLVELLSVFKEEQASDIEKSGDLWDEECDTYPWLFTQWNGKGMHYHTITHWLKNILTLYNEDIMNDDTIPEKLKADYLLPVISIHKLRHTSATLLIGQNTDIKTVSARLGHSQTSTTMNIYVHGLKSIDRKASDALEGLLSKKNRGLKIVK